MAMNVKKNIQLITKHLKVHLKIEISFIFKLIHLLYNNCINTLRLVNFEAVRGKVP